MYAVLRTGGKQYTVRENEVIQIEKLETPDGEEIIFEDVLLVNNGDKNLIGTPTVKGATITGKVVRQVLGEKVVGRTYKPKKSVSKRYGHRQQYTQILIEKISV